MQPVQLLLQCSSMSLCTAGAHFSLGCTHSKSTSIAVRVCGLGAVAASAGLLQKAVASAQLCSLPGRQDKIISASPQQKHVRNDRHSCIPLQPLHKVGLPNRLRRYGCQCLYCTSSEAHARGDHAPQPRIKGWQPCCKFLIQRITAMGVHGFRPVTCKMAQNDAARCSLPYTSAIQATPEHARPAPSLSSSLPASECAVAAAALSLVSGRGRACAVSAAKNAAEALSAARLAKKAPMPTSAAIAPSTAGLAGWPAGCSSVVGDAQAPRSTAARPQVIVSVLLTLQAVTDVMMQDGGLMFCSINYHQKQQATKPLSTRLPARTSSSRGRAPLSCASSAAAVGQPLTQVISNRSKTQARCRARPAGVHPLGAQ